MFTHYRPALQTLPTDLFSNNNGNENWIKDDKWREELAPKSLIIAAICSARAVGRSHLGLHHRHHCCSCPALIVYCLSIVDMDARGDSFSTNRLPVRQLGGKLEVNAPLDGRAAAWFSPSAGHTAFFHQHLVFLLKISFFFSQGDHYDVGREIESRRLKSLCGKGRNEWAPAILQTKKRWASYKQLVLLGRNRWCLLAVIHKPVDKVQNGSFATKQLFYRCHWTRNPIADDAARNMEEG